MGGGCSTLGSNLYQLQRLYLPEGGFLHLPEGFGLHLLEGRRLPLN